jgi:phosphoribosylanthranilate isomerase
MKTKICGITNRDDALAAVESGADAIGFIFVPTSPRHVSVELAGEISSVLPGSILTVGVFVNDSRANILQAVRNAGLKAVQFHGDESPDDLQGYDIPVIKAHRVGGNFDSSRLLQYPAYAHLLDAAVEGIRGGTGKQCDWKAASVCARSARTILSGGLSPENVAEAIRTVRPAAVDVSSGVEKLPGVKDHRKVRAFVTAAREAFETIHVLQAE